MPEKKKPRERPTSAISGTVSQTSTHTVPHSGAVGTVKNRVLTLKQMKDTIADMYA